MEFEEMTDSQGDWQPTLRFMKKMGIPLTKQNFLDVLFMGDPPKHLSVEYDDQIPPQWR